MKKIAAVCVVLAVMGCKGGEKPVATKTDTTGTTGTATKPGTDATTAASGTEVGTMLPEFSAKYLDGKPFAVTGQRGQVVLLNLWATWCPPCREEIPALQKVHDTYAARGFQVIGVSVDQGGVDVVKEFVDGKKVTYPQVLDEQEKLPLLLGATVLPTSVLLDRNGKIVWKTIGAIGEDDPTLKQAIEKSL